MDKINLIGKTVFDYFSIAAYWIIAAYTLKEIIKCATRHDTEGIIRTLIGCAVSYGSIFMVMYILDMVKGVMR